MSTTTTITTTDQEHRQLQHALTALVISKNTGENRINHKRMARHTNSSPPVPPPPEPPRCHGSKHPNRHNLVGTLSAKYIRRMHACFMLLLVVFIMRLVRCFVVAVFYPSIASFGTTTATAIPNPTHKQASATKHKCTNKQ